MEDMEKILYQFAEPPKEFSPVSIWWWSGDEIERKRLRWQMKKLVEGGIYNVMIVGLAPVCPLFGSDADQPALFSGEWWDLIEGVCKDAYELSVNIWFYDQIGFSGANHQANIVRDEPSFAGELLDTVFVEGSGVLEVLCPHEAQPLAAFAVPIDDKGRMLGQPIAVELHDGKGVFECSTPHRLRLVYTIKSGFDYFNPQACKRLLNTVHGKIEQRLGHWFGKVIVGTFQDELPSLPTWSSNFANEFTKRNGYDLISRLFYLWEGDGPEALKARLDYHRLRSRLAEESFFIPFFKWHEDRGLICGFDQKEPARNGDPIATTRYYGDYMGTHRWYGAPGSDHWGNAKIHSSIAHINGRPRTWIEAFHSTGWGGTLEETFDWLLPWFQGGANLYNPHAVYYSTKGGWWEWAPPSTCWRQPYWRHYSVFSKAIRRLCYLLTKGSHVCNIGVLYPSSAIQAQMSLSESAPMEEDLEKVRDTYKAITGEISFINTKPGILEKACRDFDILSEDALQKAELGGDGLRIRDEAYQTIILPACSVIMEETAAALYRFVKAGGLLVAIGEIPRKLDHGSNDSWVDKLRELFHNGEALRVPQPEDLKKVLSTLPRKVEAEVPTLHRRIGKYNLLFVPAAFPNATVHTRKEGITRHYDFSPERYRRSMEITLANAKGPVYLLEPTSGTCQPLPWVQEETGIRVVIPFDHGPSALLLWTDDGTKLSAVQNQEIAAIEKPETVQNLPTEWESEIVPTLDNRYGDFDYPPFDGSPPVSTWYLDHRMEKEGEDGFKEGWHQQYDSRENWQTVQITYGVQAWIFGPVKREELPQPPPLFHPESLLQSTDGWKPVIYSTSRGIPKDEIFKYQYLGPKGHVPEEFLDFGLVEAQQGVHVRTGLWMPKAVDRYLAVGAFAKKNAWINGRELPSKDEGYLSIMPVHLKAGLNVLDLQFVMEETGYLRGYWALLEDEESFRRPEWLVTPGPHRKNELVLFETKIEIPGIPDEGTIHLTSEAPSRILVNGHEIGRMGGFEPYGESTSKVYPFTTRGFKQGKNTLQVVIRDLGSPCGFILDGSVKCRDGREFPFYSGPGWKTRRSDGTYFPAQIRSAGDGKTIHRYDPSFHCLKRRPHPLPGASWLEGEVADHTVMDVAPDAYFGRERIEWFRWVLPPGASRMTLEIAGKARLWVDGEEISLSSGEISLPAGEKALRCATLRAVPEKGYSGGAVFFSPIRYKCSKGRIKLGDWCSQGLDAYSGGIRYRTVYTLDQASSSRFVLDLGAVRGTAEVYVNGRKAGICIWSPYRFDLTGLLVPGENTIEVMVFNTLAPYLNAVSPTPYIMDGQMVSGMLGPVRLLML